MIATKLAREAWQRLSPATSVESVARTLPQPDKQGLVRSGVAAGATIVALSAASAVTSAIRRRTER
ncbi:MAG TPA: hypothetical protein VFI40_08105 [Nocardioides sp.]|jgi:hypothetical protein|nr:hypothetical protein [Nocardioides sp.]